MEELLYAEESYAIRGAIFDVYFGSYPIAEVERRILYHASQRPRLIA